MTTIGGIMGKVDELFDGSNAHLLNGGEGGSSACYPLSADLLAIGELVRTQDNRITDAPLFIVQEKVRDYGYDTRYTDNHIWLDDEGCEVSKAKAKKLEAKYDDTLEEPDTFSRAGYKDRWEFVTACFTEQGCKDFLQRDGHNHGETRIYAAGSYRNEEYRTVWDFLKSLQG